MAPDPKREPLSLEQQLHRIATAKMIVDLEVPYHAAARPGAESMLSREASFSTKDIALIDDPKELAAFAAALQLRAIGLLEFWEPLLASCKAGESTAPLKDLRTLSKRARATEAVLEKRKKTAARDAVLAKARDAAEQVEATLPRRGSHTAATRYSRGAFEPEEEDDGTIRIKPLPNPKDKPKKPESLLRKIIGWILTIALIGAMGYGVWHVANTAPEPRNLTSFRALVFEVSDKEVDGGVLVFTMSAEWLQKSREEREADIATLAGNSDREGHDSVRYVDAQGESIALIAADGAVTWKRESLKPAEMLKLGDFGKREAIGVKEATTDEPSEPEEDTPLPRPLKASEVPKD